MFGISALGYTMQRPTDDHFLLTPAELKNKMAVLLERSNKTQNPCQVLDLTGVFYGSGGGT